MRGLWEFIVYGQVPGTSIQITFQIWLWIMAGMVVLLAARYGARRHWGRRLRITMLGTYAAFIIKSQTIRLQASRLTV